MIYEACIEGIIKYATLVTVTDEEGNESQINDTAGIDYTKTFEADNHLEAKTLFKNWVIKQVADRKAIGFEGTITAYTVAKTLLLEEVPFSVMVEVSDNIIVDF